MNSATAAPTDPLAVQPVTTARAAHNTQRKGQGKADGTRLSCHSCVWEQKDELMNLEQARIAANAAAQEYLATDDFPEATNRFLDLIETLLDDLNREPGTKCSGSGGRAAPRSRCSPRTRTPRTAGIRAPCARPSARPFSPPGTGSVYIMCATLCANWPIAPRWNRFRGFALAL